jgi:amidase
MATPIWQWSAVDTTAAICDGRATSEEVVQSHIDRMHTANPAINAIVVDLSAKAI